MQQLQILLALFQILPPVLSKIEEYGKATPGKEKFDAAMAALSGLLDAGAILPGVKWDAVQPIAQGVINTLVAIYNVGVWKKSTAIKTA